MLNWIIRKELIMIMYDCIKIYNLFEHFKSDNIKKKDIEYIIIINPFLIIQFNIILIHFILIISISYFFI